MPVQEYEVPLLPMGFTFRFNLYSTHGDSHYIGLNGINILDHLGQNLMDPRSNPENPPSAFADPFSVKDLADMSTDVRTPDKLINTVNNTWQDSNMWLAPFSNTTQFHSD